MIGVELRRVTVATGGPDDLFVGALVTWLLVPRGGYGYTVHVPAKVRRVGRERATLEVADARGNTSVRVVSHSNIRWRRS